MIHPNDDIRNRGTQWNPDLAYFCALLSWAGYRQNAADRGRIAAALDRADPSGGARVTAFATVNAPNPSDVRTHIAVERDCNVLVFDGITSWWDPRNGAQNALSFTPGNYATLPVQAMSAAGDIMVNIGAAVNTALQPHVGRPLLLAGHSLGGTVAQAVAYHMNRQYGWTIKGVVAYGAPLLFGNPLPADARDWPVLLLENNGDWVPSLPPAAFNWTLTYRGFLTTPAIYGRDRDAIYARGNRSGDWSWGVAGNTFAADTMTGVAVPDGQRLQDISRGLILPDHDIHEYVLRLRANINLARREPHEAAVVEALDEAAGVICLDEGKAWPFGPVLQPLPLGTGPGTSPRPPVGEPPPPPAPRRRPDPPARRELIMGPGGLGEDGPRRRFYGHRD